MGRKNNRLSVTEDASFAKFMKQVNSSSIKRNNYKHNNMHNKKIKHTHSPQDRLKYACTQFEENNIKHYVIDSELTTVEVFRKSDNQSFVFNASRGFLINIRDVRGIKEVVEYLCN